jgi:peptidoglycan/LPS O-acetylase OafA/YrhL
LFQERGPITLETLVPTELHTASSEFRSRIPELDGFRGVAILLVLTGHTLTFTLKLADYAGLKMGETGVLLFFILSGYLITRLLSDEESRTGTISLPGFYLRRARRLLPALAMFLAGLAILQVSGMIANVPAKDFAAAILYVRNIFGRSPATEHLWSLSLEEQFYTAWPLLFLCLGRKRMAGTAIGVTVLVMLWRSLAISLQLWDYETGLFYIRPWFRFDAIAIGCWLALTRLPRCPGWAFAVVAPVLAAWAVGGEQISHAMFITVQTALSALLFFSVVQGGPVIRGLLSARWLCWLGGISYSLYLWQQLFTVALPMTLWIRHFPWNILASFSLAIISRQFIERPFLAMKRNRMPNHEPIPLLRLRESGLQ